MSKFNEIVKGVVLPSLAIGESIFSRGISPGTASLGVLQNIEKREEIERQREEREKEYQRNLARDALERQLKMVQIKKLGGQTDDQDVKRRALLKKRLELAGTDQAKIEEELLRYQMETNPGKALEFIRADKKYNLESELTRKKEEKAAEKERKQEAKEEYTRQRDDRREDRETVKDRREFKRNFTLDNRVKTYQEISGSFGRMKNIWESRPDKTDITGVKKRAAIDQAMITLYNKMLDPSSVVRESEFARTPENVPVINRVVGKLKQIGEGGAGITDADRIEIYDVAKQLYASAREKYKDVLTTYISDADDSGYDLGKIFTKTDMNIINEDLKKRQEELKRIIGTPGKLVGLTETNVPINTIQGKTGFNPSLDSSKSSDVGIPESELQDMKTFITNNPNDPRAKIIKDKLKLLGVEVNNAF